MWSCWSEITGWPAWRATGQQAAGGERRLVLVAGEAGIGKTSLLSAFGERAGGSAEQWWGACDALATPRPLGPLYDIARASGGDLAAVMASDATRHQRFTAALDSLVSPLRPVIVVIEDLHWADEATRDLLVFLARRVTTTNAVVLATYRDDEIGSAHPLRPVLGHLATLPGLYRLTLEPLSEAAVTQLAAGHRPDPARVHRVTGGNPFYVTEVLAADSDGDVPVTVTDAVLARAAGLSPTARAAVEECHQHGLLPPSGRAVRLRHELGRLAVVQDIAAFRCQSCTPGP